MPQLLPDQSFYPSPSMAMKAAPETLAYVALLNPDPDRQRRAGRARRGSGLAWLRRPDRARRHAGRRRRVASLRMERLQLVSLPVLAASAHEAALPGGSRHALVAHSHPGYAARSARPAAGEGHRRRRGDRGKPATAVRTRRTAVPMASTSTRSETARATAPVESSSSIRRHSRSRAPGNAIAGRSTSPMTSGGISVMTR